MYVSVDYALFQSYLADEGLRTETSYICCFPAIYIAQIIYSDYTKIYFTQAAKRLPQSSFAVLSCPKRPVGLPRKTATIFSHSSPTASDNGQLAKTSRKIAAVQQMSIQKKSSNGSELSSMHARHHVVRVRVPLDRWRVVARTLDTLACLTNRLQLCRHVVLKFINCSS